MTLSHIEVPDSLLLDRGISTVAKVVWIASRGQGQGRPTDLGEVCGLSANTIRKGLAELTAGTGPTPSGRTISIPVGLLAQRMVGPTAKLLYGVLQLTSGFGNRSTRITHAELSTLAGATSKTVRLALSQLVETGWLKVSQQNRKKPLHVSLLNPAVYRQRLELARAKRRILRAPFKGEALMREYLSLLVESDSFEDDASPGFLINPASGERLQFDRFYPPGVALEYNGAQHYGTTDWFPSSEGAREQQLRDLIKAGICFYRGIKLVVVHAEDLSLEGMRRRMGNLLPLRDLNGHELLLDYLEKRALQYRNRASPQS